MNIFDKYHIKFDGSFIDNRDRELFYQIQFSLKEQRELFAGIIRYHLADHPCLHIELQRELAKDFYAHHWLIYNPNLAPEILEEVFIHNSAIQNRILRDMSNFKYQNPATQTVLNRICSLATLI